MTPSSYLIVTGLLLVLAGCATNSLLFRFLAIQTTLWDMVDSYGGQDADYPADEIDTKAHVLSITATLLRASHTAFVVARFADEPIAIAQLNEACFRSGIRKRKINRTLSS